MGVGVAVRGEARKDGGSIVFVKCWKVAYWNAMQIVANIQCQKSNMGEKTSSPFARHESLDQHYTA